MVLKDFRSWFRPNQILSSMSARLMVLVQLCFFLVIWATADFPFLPTPVEIGNAWWKLLGEGMSSELATSILLSLEATVFTVFISLLLVYASVMPFFRPFAELVSKFRFNGVVGLTLFFTVLTSSNHGLKVSLLVFTMVVWFVTSLREEIRAIPLEEYEHARTLGMKEWRVVWEVVVLGKLDRVVEVLRQNTAISWVMLTTVEGFVRTEGGIGAMLVIQAKYLHISEVLAIQLTILLLGVTLDWFWGFIRKVMFPYADLSIDRK